MTDQEIRQMALERSITNRWNWDERKIADARARKLVDDAQRDLSKAVRALVERTEYVADLHRFCEKMPPLGEEAR